MANLEIEHFFQIDGGAAMNIRHKQIEAKRTNSYSSEELYRILFEQATDGIFISDSSGKYIEVNPRGCEMLGYTREEILSLSIRDLLPEDDSLRYEAPAAGERTLLERNLRRKDGSYAQVEINEKILTNGIKLCLVRDTSERKLAEESLRKSEQKYRNIFEHSMDGIFQSTPGGRYLTVNPSLAHIWGYDSPEDLIESITNIAHQVYVKPEKRAEFLHLMAEYGEVEAFEFQAYRKDGGIIWVRENVHAVRDHEGNLQYYEGTVEDITEQKMTLDALRRSEERSRRTLNNMLEGCQIIDYDWRYIYVNDTAALQGRHKPEEMLMRSMLELYPGIESTELFSTLQRCMDNRSPSRMENQFTFLDGSTGWFELSIEPVPEGLFILSVDITERKQAEKKRREAEQFAQSTIDALTAHICVLDESGFILSVNRAWHDFAEANPPVPADHFVGSNYLAVCDASNGENSKGAAQLARGLRAVMNNEREQFSMEYPCNVPGGEKRWFIARVTRFTIEGASRIVVAHENISERKMMEEALRESEERFSTVFRSSPESIAITRLSDNRLIDVNEAWIEVSGFSRETAIGRTALELGTWLDPKQREKLMEQLQEKGRVQGYEVQLRTSSGKVSDILFSGELIELMGEPHMLSMGLDISDRKQAEKKIKQQLDRLTALSEIDRIIASSFDLRLTLMQLIRSVIQQLEVDAANIFLASSVTSTLEYGVGEGFLGIVPNKFNVRLSEDLAGKVALDNRRIHIPNLKTSATLFKRPFPIEKENFITYFGLPLIAKGQVNGVLEVFLRRPMDLDEEWLSYLGTLAEQAAIAIDNTHLFNNLQQKNTELSLAYDATIEGWSYALDLRDKETEGHTRRVTEITVQLGKKFGLRDDEITYTRWGALLHDIGKMGIPDSILQKPDKLTGEEWKIMKMHPVFARNMLERIHYLKSAIDIPYCHHEKWDGSGYPRGLRGEQIPFPARIFAIADVWDALTSDRPYRKAWSKEKTLDYIKNEAGKHLDPRVVKLFLESEELWSDSND